MKKPRFKTQWSDHTPDMEINNSPSMTVPDEALPMSEIVARYTRGMDLTAITEKREPVFLEDDTPPMQFSDISEAKDYIDSLKERSQAAMARLKELKAMKKAEAEAIERKKSEQKSNPPPEE